MISWIVSNSILCSKKVSFILISSQSIYFCWHRRTTRAMSHAYIQSISYESAVCGHTLWQVCPPYVGVISGNPENKLILLNPGFSHLCYNAMPRFAVGKVWSLAPKRGDKEHTEIINGKLFITVMKINQIIIIENNNTFQHECSTSKWLIISHYMDFPEYETIAISLLYTTSKPLSHAVLNIFISHILQFNHPSKVCRRNDNDNDKLGDDEIMPYQNMSAT